MWIFFLRLLYSLSLWNSKTKKKDLRQSTFTVNGKKCVNSTSTRCLVRYSNFNAIYKHCDKSKPDSALGVFFVFFNYQYNQAPNFSNASCTISYVTIFFYIFICAFNFLIIRVSVNILKDGLTFGTSFA